MPTLKGRCVSGGRLNVHSVLRETGPTWIEILQGGDIVPPGGANDVNVILPADLAVVTYEGQVQVYSNDPFTPDMTMPGTMTIEQVDYFTELYNFEYPFDPLDPNRNDMANHTLTLIPDCSGSYYQACRSETTGFPVDPEGGTDISLRDDDYIKINVSNEHIEFYGTSYGTIYIGSNVYITFLSSDAGYLENFEKSL